MYAAGHVAKGFCHHSCQISFVLRLRWSRMIKLHFTVYLGLRAGEISRNQSWLSWAVLSQAPTSGVHPLQNLQTGAPVLESAWLHGARWPAKESNRCQLQSLLLPLK